MTENKTVLLKDLFMQMCRIRFFEEKVMELRASEDIVGSVHLCNGQEAISVGAVSALDMTKDLVFPTYRGHGYTLACGAPPEKVFAELLGRETGLNGGRGGSAYHFAPSYGMYGENSIVGAGTVIASGAALAAQYDGSGRVTVAIIGDGAMNQGSVHEALNFASIRRLPTIFIIENNRYSELTPTKDMVRLERLFTRASAYGIQGVRIDGNNVMTVRATMIEAVKRARSGSGPVLIEAMTERLVGHYIGDAQHYRPEGEIDAALEREPLVRAREELLRAGLESTEIDWLERDARLEIENAADTALTAPIADPRSVQEHLYA